MLTDFSLWRIGLKIGLPLDVVPHHGHRMLNGYADAGANATYRLSSRGRLGGGLRFQSRWSGDCGGALLCGFRGLGCVGQRLARLFGVGLGLANLLGRHGAFRYWSRVGGMHATAV